MIFNYLQNSLDATGKGMQLLFLGDFLYDYEELQDDIIYLCKFIHENEYHTILNLEAPLKSKNPAKKWINLFNTDIVFEILKDLNVCAVNLANNHIMDWGIDGISYLIESLDKNEIAHFGAGRNLQEALTPIILETENQKIGFIGFGWQEEMCVYADHNSPGVAPLEKKLIFSSIDSIRPIVDKVIINMHWGYEYEVYPLPIHRKLAHKIINHRADLIIGHHPHVIQAFEIFHGKSIFYSLGNFYFASKRNMFEKVKQGNSPQIAKHGLGVLLDTKSDKIDTLFFESDSKKTILSTKTELIDITNIPIKTYDKNYHKLRTSSRKPTLHSGKWHTFINPIKLLISKTKDKIVEYAQPRFKETRFYALLQLVYKKFMER